MDPKEGTQKKAAPKKKTAPRKKAATKKKAAPKKKESVNIAAHFKVQVDIDNKSTCMLVTMSGAPCLNRRVSVNRLHEIEKEILDLTGTKKEDQIRSIPEMRKPQLFISKSPNYATKKDR